MNPLHLLRFIQNNWVPLNRTMERAGVSEMNNFRRSHDVFHHDKPLAMRSRRRIDASPLDPASTT